VCVFVCALDLVSACTRYKVYRTARVLNACMHASDYVDRGEVRACLCVRMCKKGER